MSEERDLNESAPPDPGGHEIEDLLRSLVPRQPAFHRDSLFFEAGLAAAHRDTTRGRFARAVWPAVAATLLIACGGLAMELNRMSMALDVALTAAALKPTGAVVSDDLPAGQGVAQNDQNSPRFAQPTTRAHGSRFGRRQKSREVEQIFFSNRTPGGQLTALGWIEGPPDSVAPKLETAPTPDESPVQPVRSPTYGELMRSLGG